MNDTGATRETEFVLRRLGEAFPFAPPEAGPVCWAVFTAAVLLLGIAFVVWNYYRDSRTIRWLALPLALLRVVLFVLLAAAFLLPARQTWERVEKRSRVVVLLDVSASVSQLSDDVKSAAGPKPKTRMDRVLDFLTDDRAAFLKQLLEKNPVVVYRFGTRLDDDTQTFPVSEAPAWSADDWRAWATYDFRAMLLKGLSPAAKDAVEKLPTWTGPDVGTASWATTFGKLPDEEAVPAGLQPDDVATFKVNREKLAKRIDVARSIVLGTNVADSATAAVNREAANMVQGIILFSDGRSNLGADAAYAELKDRANREKIPLFTVAVGEPRENVNILVTDVQAPDRAPPDEPFKVIVEADGVGLPGKEVDVTLALYAPGADPKKDASTHELQAKLTFQPGDPPHGVAEFLIDPDKMPEGLTEEAKRDDAKKAGKKRQLKQGPWNLVARIPRDKREVFAEAEHASTPRTVQVIENPLRVLLWASGPTREYQTVRTMLAREVQANRAEMSVYLANEGGVAGNIVQDVPPERLLNRFPYKLDTTGGVKAEDKFFNLNEYDLILAFDPDWSELSPEQIENIENWVQNLGGGLVYVAGPLQTFQLARADEGGRLKPLLQLLPVLPEDVILLRTRPIPRTPRRVTMKPSPDWDVLKLDDAVADDPVAGWERFFTGKDKYVPDGDAAKNLNPKNGFFSYYPVKLVKPGAAVLMEFQDAGEKGDAEAKPFFVANQPGKGRTAFLASGEFWRLRAVDPAFYERFWIRLARTVSAGRRNVQSFRGQVLVNKEFTSGSLIRVQARLLAPNSKPYPVEQLSPKFKVEQFDSGGQKLKEQGPFPLAAKKGAAGFDGYYAAQVPADPRQFPPGDFRYRVVVDVPDSPGDTISGEFLVRKSDPELDNAKPDFAAMANIASGLDTVRPRITDPLTAEKLRGSAADDAKAKLAFKLGETDKLALIPQCLTAASRNERNRGPVEDLWDKGFTLPESWTRGVKPSPVSVSYLLLAAVLLLAIEWTARKLARLA